MSHQNQPNNARSRIIAYRSKDHEDRMSSAQKPLSVRDRTSKWIDTTLKSLDLEAGSLICRIIRKIERIQSLSTEAERRLDRQTSADRTGMDQSHKHSHSSHSLRGSPNRRERGRHHNDTRSMEGRGGDHQSRGNPRVPNQYSRDPSTRQSQTQTRAPGAPASKGNWGCSPKFAQNLEPSRFRARTYVEDASTLLPPSFAGSATNHRPRSVARIPNSTMSRGMEHTRPEGTPKLRPPIAYDSTVAPLIRDSLAAHGLIKVREPTIKKKSVRIEDRGSRSRTRGERRSTNQPLFGYRSLIWTSKS
jgi:hypothetical protein